LLWRQANANRFARLTSLISQYPNEPFLELDKNQKNLYFINLKLDLNPRFSLWSQTFGAQLY